MGLSKSEPGSNGNERGLHISWVPQNQNRWWFFFKDSIYQRGENERKFALSYKVWSEHAKHIEYLNNQLDFTLHA